MKRRHVTFPIFFAIVLLMSSVCHAEKVWIDVRSAAEYKADHIDGDLRISHTEIAEKIESLISDKSTEIALYCRSGRRSGIAVAALKNAGYKNVSNAGGIEDARKLRGLDKASNPAQKNN